MRVFGASLDPLDATERIEIKRAYISALCDGRDLEPNFSDPYEGICSANPDLFERVCEAAGKVPVETWLTPKPERRDFPKVTSENYKTFLESNGCCQYSERVGEFLKGILPSPFVMIGVDHSQTGGVVRRLSKEYGPEQVSLIVLDAHTDMFDFDVLYAMQGALLRGQGLGDRLPKTIYDNSFYGCGSFLKSLLNEESVFPENLFIIGVTDYPGGLVNDLRGSEVRPFVEAYESILRQGVRIIPKADVESSVNKVSGILDSIDTPYVYLSIDMDVGAFFSTCAVRFLNTAGMAEDSIYSTVRTIKDVIDCKGLRCLGFDLMELDAHYAGCFVGGERDRSYDIAGNLVRMLLGMDAAQQELKRKI